MIEDDKIREGKVTRLDATTLRGRMQLDAERLRRSLSPEERAKHEAAFRAFRDAQNIRRNTSGSVLDELFKGGL